MIFVTVGSSVPFDRLIEAIDQVAASLGSDGDFVAQIGHGRYEPRFMRFVRFLDRQEFSTLLSDADQVVAHAGVGTIAETLKLSKPLLVLPRRQSLGESVNDHQLVTAQRFQTLGYVLVADSELDLADGLRRLCSFVPKRRVANSIGLARRVAQSLTIDHGSM